MTKLEADEKAAHDAKVKTKFQKAVKTVTRKGAAEAKTGASEIKGLVRRLTTKK
jgi:hypothetical protein